ncbi:MAG: cyclase family protein [Desulfobacteraceae bacterium]|jgi:kynurenine formamidase
MSSKDWIDITVLKPDMNYLKLEPVPSNIYRISHADRGDPVTMAKLEIISHTGTHADTPLHFIPGGSTITDMPLDASVGPAREELFSDL